jgi:hypothetical protein
MIPLRAELRLKRHTRLRRRLVASSIFRSFAFLALLSMAIMSPQASAVDFCVGTATDFDNALKASHVRRCNDSIDSWEWLKPIASRQSPLGDFAHVYAT